MPFNLTFSLAFWIAFFQLNLEQTNKLYNEIINLAKLKGYENVIDGYCGVGTIGIFLSKYVKEVRGIDNNIFITFKFC